MAVFGTAGEKSVFGKASGFASPAQGYEDTAIDLNALLVKHPAATFYFRLESADIEGLGIPRGALLVVDRSKSPAPNDFAVIRHEGQFLCRLLVRHNGMKVFTDGCNYIPPAAGDTEIIGTVTAAIQMLEGGGRP